MAKIVYITKEELEIFNDKTSKTGLKKDTLAKLFDCSSTYFSLMLSGRKKINTNKMPLINNILDRYISLYNELSDNEKDSNKDRITKEYGDTLAILDSLNDFSQLTDVFYGIKEGYLLDKLNLTLEFSLDSNMSIETIGSGLKNVIYCYG